MGESNLDDANVKVAVRVRPMNRREKELNTKCVVEMVKNQTILHPAGGNLAKGDSSSSVSVATQREVNSGSLSVTVKPLP